MAVCKGLVNKFSEDLSAVNMLYLPAAEVLATLHLYIFGVRLNILSLFIAIVCSCSCESCGSRPWDWDLAQCVSWIHKFPVSVQTVWDGKDEDMGMPTEDFVCERESLK